MKTILVPTDFSPDAEKAYALAGSIAKIYKAEVCLFNISRSHIDDLVGYWGGTSLLYPPMDTSAYDAMEQEETAEKLEAITKRKEFEGVNVSTKMSMSYTGDIITELLEELNHKKYGLIVMGTAGDQQEGESFAELITRNALTPIITTRSTIDSFKPKNIVFCTDFETINLGFAQRIRSFKEHYSGVLKLLYVNTSKHFMTTAQIEAAAKKMSRKFSLGEYQLFIYNANDVKTGVKEFLQREDTDMLALSTHGRTGISHYFNGSTTEDLINECDVPVYAYNLHEYLSHLMDGRRASTSSYTKGFTG